LRYHKSRFLTFIFFMPKMSGNNLDKLNQSCSALHQESRKIEFACFRSLYDFLEILQESAKVFYYWSFTFPHRPLELFKASQMNPSLALKPSGKSQSSNPYPPATGWARRRRGSASLGQHAGRDPLGAHLEAIGGVGWRGGGSGEGARWWPAVAAAAGYDSGEGVTMLGNGRRRKPL
jgi:hypothetical protein